MPGATIKKLSGLSGAGVLKDIAPREHGPEFLQYNLIYGFNGSGKSTLSRVLSSLQEGKLQDNLPANCKFSFALSDGVTHATPTSPAGLEKRVCVFNQDFIQENLQWAEGKAASIFYISAEQKQAVDELRAAEDKLAPLSAVKEAAYQVVRERDRTLTTYKRERAKTVAGKLHMGNRRYEAPQLTSDYDSIPFEIGSVLTTEALNALEDVVRQTSPPPPLNPIEFAAASLPTIAGSAAFFAVTSIGTATIEELEQHPTMVPWAKTGHEYHQDNGLDSCLFCGETLTAARKAKLAAAFDDSLTRFMRDLEAGQRQAEDVFGAIERSINGRPDAADLSMEQQPAFAAAVAELPTAMHGIDAIIHEVRRIYAERSSKPTSVIEARLPPLSAIDLSVATLSDAIQRCNVPVEKHNLANRDFNKRQDDARDAIKRHFLAEGHGQYAQHNAELAEAKDAGDQADINLAALKIQIAELHARVRTHGPAADQISKLVKSYLGHGELTVIAAEEGYELHRHGKLVKGMPSEGEKTAIALCYFLTTLGSEGRDLKDLIVVVDDPVSSLDTRAMNYACTLVRRSLRNVAQLFVLTHNQHCLNDFRKDWRRSAYPDDPAKARTKFYFLDVTIPAAGGSRTASLIELPKLLRDYDSEYHFLCRKVLEFEAAGEAYSEYGYMMPNVIRRVLEVFLAFKVPGTAPNKDKLDQLCSDISDLDPARLAALERLSQAESHSNNLDYFVSHSPMTIEETRDANAALLELMAKADKRHTDAMRKHCKP